MAGSLLVSLLLASNPPAPLPAADLALAEGPTALLEEVPGAIAVEDPPAESGATPSGKRKEWIIHLAPGFDYLQGSFYRALGGSLRIGGHKALHKGKFFIAGGPVIHYTFLRDPDFDDALHLATLNADMLIGGGNEKIVGFGHLSVGLGVFAGLDEQSGTTVIGPGARGAIGGGVYGMVTDRISVGGLLDFGWAFGLWVNPLLTVGFHFPST